MRLFVYDTPLRQHTVGHHQLHNVQYDFFFRMRQQRNNPVHFKHLFEKSGGKVLAKISRKSNYTRKGKINLHSGLRAPASLINLVPVTPLFYFIFGQSMKKSEKKCFWICVKMSGSVRKTPKLSPKIQKGEPKFFCFPKNNFPT